MLIKDTTRDKNIISSVWNKILKIWDTLFEPIQVEVQCCKIVLPQETRAFRNNIKKEPQKPGPKIELC